MNKFTYMRFTFSSILILCLAFLLYLPFRLSADDTVYTKVDVNPVPTKTPPPDYPEDLRDKEVTGVVAVVIVIDEKGSVISATISKSSNPGFDAPALEAVKKWKFKPAQIAGAPVKMKLSVPLRFNLDQ